MSNQQPFQDVEAFQQKFDLTFEGMPRHLPLPIQKLRIKLIEEELEEYKIACSRKDVVQELDALVDLMYVVIGTAYQQGFSNIWDEAWARVHRSNMNKIRVKNAAQSKRGSKFDVAKPVGWTPPNLEELINGG